MLPPQLMPPWHFSRWGVIAHLLCLPPGHLPLLGGGGHREHASLPHRSMAPLRSGPSTASRLNIYQNEWLFAELSWFPSWSPYVCFLEAWRTRILGSLSCTCYSSNVGPCDERFTHVTRYVQPPPACEYNRGHLSHYFPKDPEFEHPFPPSTNVWLAFFFLWSPEFLPLPVCESSSLSLSFSYFFLLLYVKLTLWLGVNYSTSLFLP